MKKQYCVNWCASCGRVVGADIFLINNNMLLCIVGYYSKFPGMMKADGLSAYILIRAVQMVFTKFRLPKNIVSDAGTNFKTNLNEHVGS